MACIDDSNNEELIAPENIEGGKGGNLSVAIFSKNSNKGIDGTCYIQYATKTKNNNFSAYNDSSATMVEPGFGQHAHFNQLKAGYYAIGAKAKVGNTWIQTDSLIEIKANQSSYDYYLQLK